MYGSSRMSMPKKNSPVRSKPKAKASMAAMSAMSDADYYKEHKKHHSEKHIKAMKALQRLGVDRSKAHNYVKKYVD